MIFDKYIRYCKKKLNYKKKMGKFRKTIHFIIFIKLFFINYPYLRAEDEENCCITICPCFRDFKDKLEEEKKKIEEENENLKEEKKKIEEKETNLEQKEKELKAEKEILQNQKNIYEVNKEQLNSAQQKYNEDIVKLNKDQQKYNEDIVKLNKEKEDFEKKAKELETKLIEEYKQKEIELKKEEDPKKKEEKLEQELEKKLIEKYKQRENELKQKEDSILKGKKELSEREANITKSEKSFKEKEQEFSKKNQELIEYQKKFNEEKLIQEKNFKQKEVILNQFKISLDQEKKDFEDKKKKEELSKLPNLVGLQNIGATCYMNATLQALSNTKLLTDFFLTKYKFDANAYNKKMANEYYKVLINLWSDKKKNGDYPPYDFKQAISEENPLFAGIQANDSKDLINFLLERFHQELNTAKKNNNESNNEIVNINQMDEQQTLKVFIEDYFKNNKSIISDCFYGILETRSKCSGCNITKYNFQIYSFLEFPLEQVNIYMSNLGRRLKMMNQGQNPDIDLLECFEYYQKIDLMNGQNQMYCNICNMNMDTYYGSNIYSLPNYLIINLNRGKGAVYECKVNFPENLNLLNFVTFKQGKTYFQLYAVICHLGPSSMSGHFVAYCRHKNNDKWYKYNDSFVTECTKPQEYNEGMPYILFYRAV